MSGSGVHEGQLVAGKYRVERVLGEGGMGIVVKATHVALEQSVAIKLLREEMRDKPAVVERFAREAKALARLTSEHVTHVIDVASLDDGSPYIVMEYLDGEDLAVLVEREGALPTETAVGYVLEACEAIAEAHSVRVIHRDLKPANLFLARRPGEKKPIVKVLDFGISKVLDEAVSLTKTASGLGSALYMAPEQMRNAKDCDERADVWAIGVILYELLSGEVPFGGQSVHQVVANVLDQNRKKLSERVPAVPPEIEKLVEECLVLDPKNRLRSVADIAERIAPFGPPESKDSLDRVRRFLGANEPVVLPRPEIRTRAADTDPTPSQRLELGSAKTEEHAITLPTPSSTVPDSHVPTRNKIGALVALGVALCLVAAGVAVSRGSSTPSADPALAAPPTPSMSAAQAHTAPLASAVEVKNAPSSSGSAVVPSHVAPSASDKGPPKNKSVANASASGAPTVAATPPVASTPAPPPSATVVVAPPQPKPSTGGIVPISTMGLK